MTTEAKLTGWKLAGYLPLINRLSLVCIIWMFQSCFLIKTPVAVRAAPIQDTVDVYHFVITKNAKPSDSVLLNSFARETKRACDCLCKEASGYGQRIIFKNHWPENKDSARRQSFVYDLPLQSLQKLMIRRSFRMVTRKKTKELPEKIERVDWRKNLSDSVSAHVADDGIRKIINGQIPSRNGNHPLIVFHFSKMRKSRILGFYQGSKIYIGQNKSATIAHEMTHHLGAPDIYIHKYWPGKRRRIVKKNLTWEMMNSAERNYEDCSTYYVSEYSAYTVGWKKNMDKKYTPILKQNLMARFVFYFLLLF